MHDAGNILGIDLLDHLVFSGDKYFSYRSNSEGVMKE